MYFAPFFCVCYLFHRAVDSVARVVVAGGGLLALGHDFLVQVAPLQGPHPPGVSHPLQVFHARRLVQQHPAAGLADALGWDG